MKTNRNFRYVLTVVDNDAIAAGEVSVQEKGRVGAIQKTKFTDMSKRKTFLLLTVYAFCIVAALISCAEQENAPCPKRAESVRNLSRDWDKWSEFYANVRNASPDVKIVNLPN